MNTRFFLIAALHNDLEAIVQLGKNKALLETIDEKDEAGNTALRIAIEMDNKKIVLALVELGANVNLQDNSGFSPLGFACALNRIDCVGILLAYGANIHQKNGKINKTALEIATKRGNTAIITLLVACMGREETLVAEQKSREKTFASAQKAEIEFFFKNLKPATPNPYSLFHQPLVGLIAEYARTEDARPTNQSHPVMKVREEEEKTTKKSKFSCSVQ